MAQHRSSRNPTGTSTNPRDIRIRPTAAEITDIIPFNEFGDLGDLEFRESSAFDRESQVITAPELDDLHHTDDLTPLLRDELAQWASFLQAWRAQQWVQAGALIRALAQQHQQQLLYALYQERVAARSAQPFDPNWDGSTQFETK